IEYNSNPLFASERIQRGLTFAEILKHAQGVIRKQVRLRTSFYDRNGVTIMHGTAAIVEPYRVRVTLADQTVEYIRCKQILIATGSRPYRPTDIDFNHPRIYDSDTVLDLMHEPRSIIIYGAGVIGCEYASIFRGLGVRVDLVNTRDRLLSFMDAEISDSLSYHFWNSGMTIRHGEEFDRIEGKDDGVVLHLKSGKKMKADCFLFANGRTGNTDMLNLAAIGLESDSRGLVKVNKQYQTSIDNIYAVGDVIGYPSLASAAYDQGRLAGEAIVKGNLDGHLIADIPAGIYTIPEMSSVGKTE